MREWRRGHWLVIALYLHSIAPLLLQYLAQSRPQVLSVASQIEVRSQDAARFLQVGLKLAILAIAFDLILVTAMRDPHAIMRRLGSVRLTILALWVVATGASLMHGGGLAVNGVLIPLVVLAFVGVGDATAWLRLTARLGTASAALSLLLLAVVPSGALVRVIKNSGLSAPEQHLAGVFPHPNALGLALALSLPCLLACRRRERLLGWTLQLPCIWLTASRTAIVAAVAALLVVAIAGRPAIFANRLVRYVATFLLAIPVVGWFIVENAAPLSFSGRGSIWISLRTLQPTSWLGEGGDFFTRNATSGGELAYAFHAHNQILNALVTSGLVGVSLLGCLCLLLGARVARHANPAFLGWWVAWLVLGVFEVPSDWVAPVSTTAFSLIPMLALSRPSPSPEKLSEPAPQGVPFGKRPAGQAGRSGQLQPIGTDSMQLTGNGCGGDGRFAAAQVSANNVV